MSTIVGLPEATSSLKAEALQALSGKIGCWNYLLVIERVPVGRVDTETSGISIASVCPAPASHSKSFLLALANQAELPVYASHMLMLMCQHMVAMIHLGCNSDPLTGKQRQSVAAASRIDSTSVRHSASCGQSDTRPRLCGMCESGTLLESRWYGFRRSMEFG
jgi:hypothetical protein